MIFNNRKNGPPKYHGIWDFTIESKIITYISKSFKAKVLIVTVPLLTLIFKKYQKSNGIPNSQGKCYLFKLGKYLAVIFFFQIGNPRQQS